MNLPSSWYQFVCAEVQRTWLHYCWIIGQQTIAERNVDGVEFRMKQTKYVLCTLKNLF